MNVNFILGSVRDSFLWAGVGYVVGHLSKTSPGEVAIVFAIATIAQRTFALLNYYSYYPVHSGNLKDISYLNSVSSMVIGSVTAVALNRMELLTSDQAVRWGSIFVGLKFFEMFLI